MGHTSSQHNMEPHRDASGSMWNHTSHTSHPPVTEWKCPLKPEPNTTCKNTANKCILKQKRLEVIKYQSSFQNGSVAFLFKPVCKELNRTTHKITGSHVYHYVKFFLWSLTTYLWAHLWLHHDYTTLFWHCMTLHFYCLSCFIDCLY